MLPSRRRAKVASTKAVFTALEPLEPRQLLAGDLTGVFAPLATTSLPSGTSIPVSFTLENPGDASISGKMKVNFLLSSDAAADPGDKVLLSRKLSGSLAAGDDATFNLNLPIPSSAVAGNYRIITVLDVDGQIVEGDEGNNTIASDAFDVTQPDYNLNATVSSITVLPAYLSGTTPKGVVRIEVTNTGTTKLPKKQNIQVQIFARPNDATDNTQDILIDTLPKNALPNLGAGKSKKITRLVPLHTQSGKIKTPLADGTYKLVAVIDSAGELAETNEADNTAIMPDTFKLAPSFQDAAITNLTTFFKNGAGDNNDKGKFGVVLRNLGNAFIKGTADLNVYATLNGILDDAKILVGKLDNQKLNIKPGNLGKYKVPVQLTDSLEAGNYQFVVNIEDTQAWADFDPSNNTRVAPEVIGITEVPGILGNLGNTLTLTMTKSETTTTPAPVIGSFTVYSEEGTFVDSKGNVGTYIYVLNSVIKFATFTVSATNISGTGANLQLYHKGKQTKPLGGHSLVFSDTTGPDGSWLGAVRASFIDTLKKGRFDVL